MPGFELFGDAERKEVNDVLESGVLMRYGFDGARNGHWKAKELEQELQHNLGVKHAQLTSSGTTALNVALAVLGVGAGDEVIMPTFTFVASFESILAAGATPILVEIDEEKFRSRKFILEGETIYPGKAAYFNKVSIPSFFAKPIPIIDSPDFWEEMDFFWITESI